MFEKLLVAVDGSDHSDRAIHVAADLAAHYDCELIIMHVVHDPTGSIPRGLDEYERLEHVHITERDLLESAGEHLVLQAETQARRYGAQKVTTTVVFGHPASQIVDYVDHNMKFTDAVVMGRRGLGDIGSLVLGSVSHRVAHDAACTVITVS